jgi:hypothetical protein
VPGENRLRGKGVSKTLALESLTEEERKSILGNNAMNVLNTISLKRKLQQERAFQLSDFVHHLVRTGGCYGRDSWYWL